jgi:N-acetyl-alpha-D-glucosaminyl L-malate synthase BshA
MARQILRSQGIEIPFVTTLHGTDITLVGKDPSFEPVITFCINESNAVTAVSESLKRDTYSHFNTTREISVIPNFIVPSNEPSTGCSNLRRRYAKDDERILCHISNFRKVKRVEDVLQIFSLVRKRMPSKLILAGDGPERNNLERLARELDIWEDVIFLGKVRDTAHVLEIADVFLLPSETESFGLAALEAMAVGVPVISSNTGGIPEVNIHGETGFLSNVGDVEEMAENTLTILQDDKLHQAFRKNALQRSHAFALDKILPMYEAIYTAVVK